MIYLLVVSLMWAFSFGLIKHYLVGVDSNFVAWARMCLALPLFLPFLRCKSLTRDLTVRLIVVGSVQFGFMYSAYLYAFRFLDAYAVALFTIFTPLYVTLINDFFTRRLQVFCLLMAALAVAGAAIIRYQATSLEGVLKGFLLMQSSNLCFAFGQIEYRRLRRQFAHLKDHEVYAFLYLGAVIATTLMTTISGGWIDPTMLEMHHLLVLLYLGLIASGIGFFLWNKGAVETNAGTLAVFNNIKIPLGVFVSLAVFGEQTDIPRLLMGGGLMALALFLAERRPTNDRKH